MRINGLRSEKPGAGTGGRKKFQTRFFEGGPLPCLAAKTRLGNRLMFVGNVKAHAGSIPDRQLRERFLSAFFRSGERGPGAHVDAFPLRPDRRAHRELRGTGLAHFGVRMSSGMDFPQLNDADIGVDLSRVEPGMTKQLLNEADVGPVLQHVRGAGMAQ